jgi:hypothetical protein
MSNYKENHMGFVDDAKDNVEDMMNDAENKFHETKGRMEGYNDAKSEDRKEMCDCGKEGCTCEKGKCDC